MERVSFLVEASNERLSCMLNPESIVIRRESGVRPRESLNGPLSSLNQSDNPVLFTGAGITSLELDLLFDVCIEGSTINSEDVRDLTRPIWDLAENQQRQDRLYHPALCRFIWGKGWNIPGVITAAAERLESFTAQGIPRRSWLRLRMLRQQEQTQLGQMDHEPWNSTTPASSNSLLDELGLDNPALNTPHVTDDLLNEITTDLGQPDQRVDLVAFENTGSPYRWREIMSELGLTDPLQNLPTDTDTSAPDTDAQDTENE